MLQLRVGTKHQIYGGGPLQVASVAVTAFSTFSLWRLNVAGCYVERVDEESFVNTSRLPNAVLS
jgi:hypothetical protein